MTTSGSTWIPARWSARSAASARNARGRANRPLRSTARAPRRRQPQRHELLDLLLDRDLGREALGRGGAVEAVEVAHTIEEVGRVLRERNRAAVAEDERVGAQALHRVDDRLHVLHALVER